jgi:hypothetical protein
MVGGRCDVRTVPARPARVFDYLYSCALPKRLRVAVPPHNRYGSAEAHWDGFISFISSTKPPGGRSMCASPAATGGGNVGGGLRHVVTARPPRRVYPPIGQRISLHLQASTGSGCVIGEPVPTSQMHCGVHQMQCPSCEAGGGMNQAARYS